MLFGYISAVLALAIAYAIETSAWWIRGLAGPSELGLYLSRSNIYLFCARIFALIFNALVASRIERADPSQTIIAWLSAAFLVAALTHMAILRGTVLTWNLMRALRVILALPMPEVSPDGRPAALDRTLVMSTGISSYAFSLGVCLPMILALLFPSYRLSLSYSSQLINAGGTLLLLFYVDQRLFRALDAGRLVAELPSYTVGRACGFALAGVTCFGLGFLAA